jgi:hypothetical protein
MTGSLTISSIWWRRPFRLDCCVGYANHICAQPIPADVRDDRAMAESGSEPPAPSFFPTPRPPFFRMVRGRTGESPGPGHYDLNILLGPSGRAEATEASPWNMRAADDSGMRISGSRTFGLPSLPGYSTDPSVNLITTIMAASRSYDVVGLGSVSRDNGRGPIASGSEGDVTTVPARRLPTTLLALHNELNQACCIETLLPTYDAYPTDSVRRL